MSIATKTGDAGKTSLFGGLRVSKADLRVETYGTIDELNSVLGAARSICKDKEVAGLTQNIQRELFAAGSAVAAAPGSKTRPPEVTSAMIDFLTEQVHRVEAMEGIIRDWILPGAHPAAAMYDVARTVCRRAERRVVRLIESGEEVSPLLLIYLNRLSDLLWLFGRLLEVRAGVEAALRPEVAPDQARPGAW